MKAKGAFLNTEPALCSIHESGSHVFGCLKDSDRYDLDLFDLSEIDLDLLRNEGQLRFTGDRSGDLGGAYDFWILNYHPLTMAPHFVIDRLPLLSGRRYAMVLEMEPGDPLAFIDRDAFDGYLVLDPSADAVGKVHPFPRPLRGMPRAPVRHNRSVPIIGSFGMGTPGKGFEQVIEAVNREFDEAVIRINVPHATYADEHMRRIHDRPYAEYLQDLCRSVAKPGKTIEFTREFMSEEALVDWCAANDLNIFLYSRRQSGLSATTDQAILSGQPLAISSNDTFRHIQTYVRPYPLQGLREAIANSAGAVAAMQRDWSQEAFRQRFEALLQRDGVAAAPDIVAPLGRRERSPTRTILVIRPSRPVSGGMRHFGESVVDALKRLSNLGNVYSVGETVDEIACCLSWVEPDQVIVFSPEGAVALDAAVAATGASVGDRLLIASTHAFPDPVPAGFRLMPRRPIVPYFTSVVVPPQGVPHICLIGFSGVSAPLEIVIARILRELGEAVIHVVGMPGDRRSLSLRVASLGERIPLNPRTHVRVVDLPASPAELVNYLGTQKLTILADDRDHHDALLTIAEFALCTEQAVRFVKSSRFVEFAGREPLLENSWLPDVLRDGRAGHVSLVAEFGEGGAVVALGAFGENDRSQATRHGERFPSFTDAAYPNGVVGKRALDWYGTEITPRSHSMGYGAGRAPEAPYARAQQGFILRGARYIAGGLSQPRAVIFGDFRRPVVEDLRKRGVRVIAAADAPNDVPAFDLAIATTAFDGVEDGRDVIERALGHLKPGGGGVFTFFFHEPFALHDPLANPDFPVITAEEITRMLADLPITLVGPPSWHSIEPQLATSPFEIPALGTLLFRSRVASLVVQERP